MASHAEAYRSKIVPKMIKQFGYKNRMQVPKIEKVVLNMGLGEAVSNIKVLDSSVAELEAISGQHVVITRAKKSIAGFKLREGMPIGCMVTLRGERMYSFINKLVGVAIPRVRDFRGLSDKSFDGRGNYTFGLKEQIIFPEIDYDKVEKIKGMNVTIVTSAETDEEGRALLRHLGMPFRRR